MSPWPHLKLTDELDASLAPELLIKAFNDSFTGDLFLTSSRAQPAAFRFFRGVLVRSTAPLGRQEFLNALSGKLPVEQITLALGHAREQRVDEFTAVEQLMLLPPLALSRLLQDCLLRELQDFARAPGTFHFRFEPFSNQNLQPTGIRQGLEPLLLIAETLVESPYLAKCREMLLPTSRSPLIVQGCVLDPHFEMRGHLRQIVSSLRRQPESLENLRLRRVAPESALIAVVYTLMATHCLEAQANIGVSVELPSPVSSASAGITAPRRASISGVREINLPGEVVREDAAPSINSSAMPESMTPRSATPTSRSMSPPSGSQSYADEHTLEQSALDAWMRAMDNRALAKKALKIAERSAARAPRNPSILYYYGCLLSLNENYIEAEVALKRVLRFEPDHVEAREELEKVERLQKSPQKHSLLSRWVGRKS